MSIQSTRHIDRGLAIIRIQDVAQCVLKKNYLKLEEICFEPEEDLATFVTIGVGFDPDDVASWTNKMLENVLDKPFFRHSIFDNYVINEESV